MPSWEMVMSENLKPIFTETFGELYLQHMGARTGVDPIELLWLGFINGYTVGRRAGVKTARRAVEKVEQIGLVADDEC